MLPEPLEVTQLATLDAQTFEQFLLAPDTLALSTEATATLSPTKALRKLAGQTVATPNGRMLLIDAVVGTLVERALAGDMRAINKIYDELEHDGVHKVQTMSIYREFKDEFNDILEDVGVNTVDSTASEVNPSEKLTQSDLPSSATYDSEDELSAFLNSHSFSNHTSNSVSQPTT